MLSWTCIVLFFVPSWSTDPLFVASLCVLISLLSHFRCSDILHCTACLSFTYRLYAIYRQDGPINTTQTHSTLLHLYLSPWSDGFLGSLTCGAHAEPLRTSRVDLWDELHNMRSRTSCKFLLSFVQPADWRYHLPAFQRRKICNMLPCGQ